MLTIVHTASEFVHVGALVEQAAGIVELDEMKMRTIRGRGNLFFDRIPKGTSLEEVAVFMEIVTGYLGKVLSEGPSDPDRQLDPTADQYHRARLLALLSYAYRAFGGRAKSEQRLNRAATILFNSVTRLPGGSASSSASSPPAVAPFANLRVMGGDITGRLDRYRAYSLEQSEE